MEFYNCKFTLKRETIPVYEQYSQRVRSLLRYEEVDFSYRQIKNQGKYYKGIYGKYLYLPKE